MADLSIAIGYYADGKVGCLYAGDDFSAAEASLKNGIGLVKGLVLRNPAPVRRVYLSPSPPDDPEPSLPAKKKST